jgi:hypothetical protein
MSSELLYTSAPQGLKVGSRGFTTVLCTAGMPPNLADKLESFSGYKHVYAPQDPLAEHNPVRYAYLRPSVGGRTLTVVSRLAAYGVDYSGRSNKIAHHIVLENSERPSGGPAWLLSQNNLWKESWDGQCKTLPTGPQIPFGDRPPRVCRQWQAVTGDAGWGGQLITWLKQSTKPIWLIYEPKQSGQLLHLLVEALALLPEGERWKYTFATYFPGLPGDVDCRIRGIASGSDEARLAPARGHVIDLTRKSPLATASIWIEAARTGIVPSAPTSAPALLGSLPDLDPVLGEWEMTTAAPATKIESNWLDEPSLPNISGPPQDFLMDPGEYQLAPPPMPNVRTPKNKPPALPKQNRKIHSTDRSPLRWAVPAIAVILTLLLLGVGGVMLYKQPKVLSSVREKADPPKPTTETVRKEELAQNNPVVVEISQENADPNHLEELPKKQITIFLKKDGRLDQSWEWESDKFFELSIPENMDGETGYKLTCDGDSVPDLSFGDNDFLSINEGKIVIVKQQDYEGDEWKRNPRNFSLLVTVEGGLTPSVSIPIKINLENEKRNVQAVPVTMSLDSELKEGRVNVQKIYENELDEVENFSFDLIENEIAVKKAKGKYGQLSIENEDLVYTLSPDELSNATMSKVEEKFTYKVNCNHAQSDDKNQVIITITNKNVLGLLVAETKDGTDLQFKREDIKKLFRQEGDLSILLRHKEKVIGKSDVYKIEKNGKVFNVISNNEVIFNGIGRIAVFPNTNDRVSKVNLLEDSELKTNLQVLFWRTEKFCDIFEEELDKERRQLDTKIAALTIEITNEKNGEVRKQKEGEKEIFESDNTALLGLFGTIKKTLKDGSRSKPEWKYKPLKEYVETDVKNSLENLINSFEEKNQRAISVLERCRLYIISRFEESRSYIRDCSLIAEKRDVSANGSVSTTERPVPPLGGNN